MTAANALAWFAQVAVIVVVCAGLPRLVGLRSAMMQHLFWRVVLAICLVVPFVEPRLPQQMVFVAAPPVIPSISSAAGPAPAAPPPAAVDWVRVAAIAIGAGMAVRLAWIAAGLLRLRRLRRDGVEPATGFDDVRAAIGAADVPILWSSQTSHPVTFGARRPVVLLPVAIRSADDAAQRAVVAHELHHVKRHDWLWTIAEEIVRALFWFHPAMWWLISRVQLARETVVDELSILTTNSRRAYLDTLLAFADDTGLQSSTAFSARRHLFHRVMLLSKEGSMSSTRIAVASCLLVVALVGGTWKAVSAFPLRGGTAVQQVSPPAPPPSALEARQANQTLATSYFEIAQNDPSLTEEQKRAAIAKGIAAEDRVLAIDPNDVPALVYKNILLRLQANLSSDPTEQQRLIAEADELRHTAILLQRAGAGFGTREVAPDGSMPPPPPPPPPPPTPGSQMQFMPDHFAQQLEDLRPVRVGGPVKVPTKIRDVRPVYPPIALQSDVQGVVIAELLIGADGAVVDARVVRSIPLLDQAALDAVRQWRFTPTTINGTPEPVLMTVTVNFTLRQ